MNEALLITTGMIGGVTGILGFAAMLVSYGIWRGKLEGKLDSHIKTDSATFARVEQRQDSAASESAEIKAMVSETNQRLARMEGRMGKP